MKGSKVVKHLLPVEYKVVSHQIPAWISEYKPEIIIHVGVGQKGCFKLEQVGHNGTYSKADNSNVD